MRFDTSRIDFKISTFHSLQKDVSEVRALVDENSTQGSSMETGTTQKKGLPYCLSSFDWQKESSRESFSLINVVYDRSHLDLHDINENALVETNFLPSEINEKAGRGWFDSLTWVAALG